jgi:NtrC-family two-component system sensor histidine kinase KinB
VPMEPSAIVDRAVDALAADFRDKGVSLERQLPASLPRVLADPVRIDHAIGNLLRNALKFTHSGGQVSVSAREDGGGVAFRVLDTGAGIPAEHRSRIFERFYRVPGQPEAGAGLGLAIAKEVALAHGGRIWLEDQPGPGSAFGLWLPAAGGDRLPQAASVSS